jgi:hypothetical protein
MLDTYFNDVDWTIDTKGNKTPVYKWKLRDELLDYNIILM